MANLQIKNNGIVYTLLYTNSVLLFNPKDSVLIEFDWLDAKRTFEFIFTNKNEIAEYNISWKIDSPRDPNKVIFSLNKWYSDSFVENVDPLEFIEQLLPNPSNAKLKIKMRLTSKGEEKPGFSKFEISIYSS